MHTTATCGGNISSDGGATVIERGVCWSTSQFPTIANNKTSDGEGTGSFSSNITELNAETTYYVRAYATNSLETSYGEQISFNTLSPNQYGYYIGLKIKGGIIFYIDETGQHGLIAAESDQSRNAEWGCFGTLIGGTSISIGEGESNTFLIGFGCSSEVGTAAAICLNLNLNGYSDWYLPSKNELNLMYVNRNVLGSYYLFGYWSSSEDDEDDAWAHVFGSNMVNDYQKVLTLGVRAIRSF
jgi:hypothetical protein